MSLICIDSILACDVKPVFFALLGPENGKKLTRETSEK